VGKRSDFERVERDFYPTPLPAVRPLIPHLGDVVSYAEPCCGDGDLVRHLSDLGGAPCVYFADKVAGHDALLTKTTATPAPSSRHRKSSTTCKPSGISQRLR
jgi:hypothetical protein